MNNNLRKDNGLIFEAYGEDTHENRMDHNTKLMGSGTSAISALESLFDVAFEYATDQDGGELDYIPDWAMDEAMAALQAAVSKINPAMHSTIVELLSHETIELADTISDVIDRHAGPEEVDTLGPNYATPGEGQVAYEGEEDSGHGLDWIDSNYEDVKNSMMELTGNDYDRVMDYIDGLREVLTMLEDKLRV